jgi:hypothetical protein
MNSTGDLQFELSYDVNIRFAMPHMLLDESAVRMVTQLSGEITVIDISTSEFIPD